MLCKRTMRAALAPVIGLIGALAATSASAVELGQRQGFISLANLDQNAPARYAAETLSNTGCFLVGRNCSGYKIVATGTAMTLTATTDILLPSQGVDQRYYVRYDFEKAIFARALVAADLQVDADGRTRPDPADPTNEIGTGTAVPSATVAYRGAVANSSVIFQLDATPSAGYPQLATFALDLSGMEVAADATATPPVAADPGYADIYVTGTGSVTASISVHATLTGAVDGEGALFSAGPSVIAQVDRTVGGGITSRADVADVSTSTEDGGPFRRFIPTGMGGKDSGVLATVTTSVAKRGSRAWGGRGYRNAGTGYQVTDAILANLSANATSDPGNFAVATKNGGAIVGGRGEVTNRKPWMLSTSAACADGGLDLGVVGGTIETYKSRDCPIGSPATCTGDPDGTGATGGPFLGSDLTPEGIASANIASGTGLGRAMVNAETGVATNYFCVLVRGNTEPIPEIGDPMMPGEYALTVTPVLANADDHPVKPGALEGGAQHVGAIDRNGTTVHLTYLSTHEAYNQRLVIVNRGADAAMFWIEDDSFNLEDDTKLMTNNLSPDMEASVPGNGRLVIRIQDNITFDGKSRGAATVNVAAPERDIDVMTIQVHPGTGQIDTTVYQNAE